MTRHKSNIDMGICRMPQWVNDEDYDSPDRAFLDKPKITINGPPQDGKCHLCNRHVSELKSFGGPGDPLVGDFSGAKLVKRFREDFPDQIGSSWECRDCFVREGPLWVIEKEDRLGHPLSEQECIDLRNEWVEHMGRASDC